MQKTQLVKLSALPAWELLQKARYSDGSEALPELGYQWGRLTKLVRVLANTNLDHNFLAPDRTRVNKDGHEEMIVLSGQEVVDETAATVGELNQQMQSYRADGHPDFSIFDSLDERANMLFDRLSVEFQFATNRLKRLLGYTGHVT